MRCKRRGPRSMSTRSVRLAEAATFFDVTEPVPKSARADPWPSPRFPRRRLKAVKLPCLSRTSLSPTDWGDVNELVARKQDRAGKFRPGVKRRLTLANDLVAGIDASAAGVSSFG